jgi:hypothetical protein
MLHEKEKNVHLALKAKSTAGDADASYKSYL